MRRGKDEEEALRLGIQPIDLVVCNLYDFAKEYRGQQKSFEDLIEFMDIGGSTLLRSTCKNYRQTLLLVDPADYTLFLDELRGNKGCIPLGFRERCAVKGMNVSADYEAFLAKVFTKQLINEETHRPKLREGKELRYGENPDQKAWVYRFEEEVGIAKAKILNGKELSYNNYEDATVAYNAAQELLELEVQHGVAIVKHGSLCAYAAANTIDKAFEFAWQGDSKSAYGSVIAFTSPITIDLIHSIENKFVEVLIAPKIDTHFVDWALHNKPKLRLLEVPNRCKPTLHYKNINGGMLIQTRKEKLFDATVDDLLKPYQEKSDGKIGVVTKRQPNPVQGKLFAFGIAAVNFAKSNAIAIVREPEPGAYQLIGMGAGQPNRVDCLERLAIPKAVENLQNEHHFNAQYNPKIDLEKCVLASDGFFPFDDSIRYAAKSGIKNCIQPGGSIRDAEVIHAADELDLCMVFTGKRYFYH